MAMKANQSQENTQKPIPGSTKRQVVSRLRRAIEYAENLTLVLHDRSAAKASTPDILEAQAYLSMLKGTLDFEKSRWSPCIQNYSLAHMVYTTLGSHTRTDVYKDLLGSIVDPSIRYAAYQLKMPRTKPVTEIVLENFPTGEGELRKDITDLQPSAFESNERSKQAKDGSETVPSHLSWRARKVKLEDAAISQALGDAQEREKALQDKFAAFTGAQSGIPSFISAYDDVITARQDAADATKTAIDELASEGVDPGDSRMQSLQITRTAVNYAVIEWRIGRNRILCGPQDGLAFEVEKHRQSTKPAKDGKPRPAKVESAGRKLSRLRERTALYDSILQSLDSVKELPGVIADEAFIQELDSKRSYFRALKCLAIGRSHAANGHILNALSLYAHALSLVEGAASTPTDSPSSSSAPKLNVSSDAISNTKSHLSALVTQYRALAELNRLTTPPTNTTGKSTTNTKVFKRPFIETLHQNQYSDYVDLTNLVNYPPKLQPIPVKPLFFDLAWNYIQYPGHEKEVGAVNGASKADGTAQAEEKPAKKGWFGFGRG
jgi:signal recognition particle subunit SRP68